MATFKDIAKLAGVSYGTVSNVLNKRGNVSLEKIKLVEKAANELNYYKNEQASALRSNKKTDVALIIPILDDANLRKIYSLLLKKVTHLNLRLNLYISDFNPALEEEYFKLSLASNKFIIIDSCIPNIEKHYGSINTKDSKVVFINNQNTFKKKNFFFINFDEEQLFDDLHSHIKNNHYQNILFFSDFEFKIQKVKSHELVDVVTCLQPYNISTSIDILSNKFYDLIITTSREKYESIMSARKVLQLENNINIILISDFNNDFDTHALLYYQDANLLVEKLFNIIEDKLINDTEIKLPYTGFSSLNKRVIINDYINVLMIESPTTTALLKVKSFIEQKIGFKINIDVIKYNQYDILSNEDMMQRYDLIRLDMAYLAEVAKTVFKPLNENYRHIQKRFVDNLDEYSFYQNTMYALPFDISCTLLMYRSDILNNQIIKRQYYEQTRHNNTVPKCYDEYNNLELFINKNYGNIYSPSTVCIGSSITCGGEFLIRVDEDNIVDSKGNLDLYNNKVQKALSSYLLSVSLAKNTNNQFWDDVVKEYAEGNTIMSLVYSNYIHMLKDFNKEILYKTNFTYPPNMKSLIGGGIIGLSKFTNKDDLCYVFLETLYSDQISKLITHLGGTLPTKSIYKDISLVSIYPWLKLIPNIIKNNTRIHNDYKTIELEKSIGRQVKEYIMKEMKKVINV